VGVVVIGRNEGARLERCLKSARGPAGRAVYVDSGSADGSAERALALGAEVVQLDMARPFTAARARNAGLARLLAMDPGIDFVQFVDGDCELAEGWIELAARELERCPDVAVLCGRRRERHPEASSFNRLCDLEWNTPLGEASACGGDALMRARVISALGGYREDMIAGEEPELCVRIRDAGWKILRADAEMTLHDAAMTRWSQWWRRTLRSGHAYAEGAALHGGPPWFHNRRQVRSTFFWGLACPGALAISLLAALVEPRSLLGALGIVLLYGMLMVRVYRHRRRRGDTPRDSRLYAIFICLGKLPEAVGMVRYWSDRLLGRRRTVIEYRQQGTV
jgi:glycosyltransferase involved in cell wall biosynthesis